MWAVPAGMTKKENRRLRKVCYYVANVWQIATGMVPEPEVLYGISEEQREMDPGTMPGSMSTGSASSEPHVLAKITVPNTIDDDLDKFCAGCGQRASIKSCDCDMGKFFRTAWTIATENDYKDWDQVTEQLQQVQ